MKLTDHRIVAGVGMGIVALGALGFALGLQQGQRGSACLDKILRLCNTRHHCRLTTFP